MAKASSARFHPAMHLRVVRDHDPPVAADVARGARARVEELETALLRIAELRPEDPAVLAVISEMFFGSTS